MPQPAAKPRTGLPRFPKAKQLTQEEATDLTEAVLAVHPAMTIRAIATETNRACGSIYNLLKANGVTVEPRGGS